MIKILRGLKCQKFIIKFNFQLKQSFCVGKIRDEQEMESLFIYFTNDYYLLFTNFISNLMRGINLLFWLIATDVCIC